MCFLPIVCILMNTMPLSGIITICTLQCKLYTCKAKHMNLKSNSIIVNMHNLVQCRQAIYTRGKDKNVSLYVCMCSGSATSKWKVQDIMQFMNIL